MRFTQFFVLAPALLAVAQQTTDSSTSASSSNTRNAQSQTSSSASSSSSSSASASQSSNNDNSNSDIITKTWNGGQATLVTNANGNIVGTVFGPNELASTLNNNDNLGTVVSNVPPTVYTTTGQPQGTSSGNPNVKTRTVGGGPVTLILNNGNIVGTVYGPHELASTINNNHNLKTRVSSVPLTTFTTSESIPQQTQGSGNAAPAVTGAPMLAGGLLGAGMVVVGLL